MIVQPYLMFEGRCDEAIEFYKVALDAKLNMLMRFKDSPECPPSGFAPEMLDKVMHSSLTIGDSVVMASDGRCRGTTTFEGVTLSLNVESETDAERYFLALSDGGKVTMPLGKTFFSPRFGMVTDRFGVSWIVLVQE